MGRQKWPFALSIAAGRQAGVILLIIRSARCVSRRLQPLRHARFHNFAIRQNDNKEHLSQWSFDRV
ncbi:MAG: hypothetical protein QOH31_67 [Verrucomicrobiota bacterium]